MNKKNIIIMVYVQLLFLFSVSVVFSQQNINIPASKKNHSPTPFFGFIQDTIYASSNNKAQAILHQAIHSANERSAQFNKLFSNSSPGSRKKFVIAGPIILTITSNGTTCGYSNGAIIAVASGGRTPYIYNISGGGPQNTGNFPEKAAGTYTVTVTDADGLTASADVTLTNDFAPPKIDVIDYTRATGCSTLDATVTVEGSGGLPPYTYSLDMINYQTSPVFTNLSAGYYMFFVKDANGCIDGIDASGWTFGLGCHLSGGFAFSQAVCKNEGTIHYELNAGTPPYLYSLDGINYQGTGDFKNIISGIYHVYVKDATGFVSVFTFSIYQYCVINLDFITVDAACQQTDGSLIVTASNGATPYTYTIDGINYQSSNVFTGLPAGNYYVTVKDADGVPSSGFATVYDRCPVVSAVAAGENCSKNDGSITATGVKGTTPYQFSIDGVNYQSSNVFTGLVAGAYTITLKDANGFTSTTNVTVSNACISVMAIGTNTVCGNQNGSITVTAENGINPYQYSTDGINFQNSNVFTNLFAGNYIVTVKDANGNAGTATVSLTDTPAPQLILNSTNSSCNNTGGSIIIATLGGTLPFQYSIDGTNYQTGNIFSNLATGAYSVSIKDGNGCTAVSSITVNTDCPTVTAVSTNETCNNANGTITATGAGGTAPYQYSKDGINFQTNNKFISLAAGTYTITIKDAMGSANTTDVKIANICPVITVIVTNGICGTANGSIIATGSNGTTPYIYSINGIDYQAANIFNGLTSGNYIITIKDANGLTNTTTAFVMNFPGPLATVASSPSSCLNNDGIITITATGGSQPLKYSVDGINFQPANTFKNISPGNYTVIVNDANGCSAPASVSVAMNNNLTLSIGNPVTICEGSSATLPASSNGTSFNWSPAASLDHNNILKPEASPVSDIKYYITATLGVCSKTDSVKVFINPAPVAFAEKDSSICYGQSVQLKGNGGIIYTWKPGTYLNNAYINDPVVTKPAVTSTYYLTVTDANGCHSLQEAKVTITVIPTAKVFAGNDTAITINEPFPLKAKDINNSGFTIYSWSPSYGLNNTMVQNPVAVLDKNTTYTVTAATESGCQASDEINIKVFRGPDIYVPTAFTPNSDGHNDLLKALPVGIKEFKYFIIYNRWGQKVFSTSDPSAGWDGKFGNIPQNTNTFVWITKGVDFRGAIIERKGLVTLIR